MEKEMEKKKFYKTTWFLIVLGIFLPAIAMVLLWLQKERSQMQKIVFTIIFSAWWLLGFLTNSIIMNKNKSPKVEQSSLSVAETTIQEETEMISESNQNYSNNETFDFENNITSKKRRLFNRKYKSYSILYSDFNTYNKRRLKEDNYTNINYTGDIYIEEYLEEPLYNSINIDLREANENSKNLDDNKTQNYSNLT